MERERFPERRQRFSADGPPSGDSLNQQRAEVDGLLRASDHVFDSINNLHAQTYLEQNLQTGGQ
jgi:hypothetical protein